MAAPVVDPFGTVRLHDLVGRHLGVDTMRWLARHGCTYEDGCVRGAEPPGVRVDGDLTVTEAMELARAGVTEDVTGPPPPFVVPRPDGTYDVIEPAAVLEEVARRLLETARRDPLTGVGNRRALAEAVHEARRESDRLAEAGLSSWIAVVIGDLEGFKDVNDTYGHPAGDEVLVALAGRMVAAVGQDGTVCRLGGDEFAVVICAFSPTHVQAVADRVLACLRDPFGLSDGTTVAVGMSVGVATAASNGTGDPLDLLAHADRAMAAAKASQRTVWQQQRSGDVLVIGRCAPAPAVSLRRGRSALHRLASIADRHPDPLARVLPDGAVLFANRAFRELVGGAVATLPDALVAVVDTGAGTSTVRLGDRTLTVRVEHTPGPAGTEIEVLVERSTCGCGASSARDDVPLPSPSHDHGAGAR